MHMTCQFELIIFLKNRDFWFAWRYLLRPGIHTELLSANLVSWPCIDRFLTENTVLF